jgi:hypothetical protein
MIQPVQFYNGEYDGANTYDGAKDEDDN